MSSELELGLELAIEDTMAIITIIILQDPLVLTPPHLTRLEAAATAVVVQPVARVATTIATTYIIITITTTTTNLCSARHVRFLFLQ